MFICVHISFISKVCLLVGMSHALPDHVRPMSLPLALVIPGSYPEQVHLPPYVSQPCYSTSVTMRLLWSETTQTLQVWMYTPRLEANLNPTN